MNSTLSIFPFENTRQQISFWAVTVLLVFWNVLSWDFPFFWDTISVSRHATFFLNHNFDTFVPPEAMDPGHPTLSGLYMALIWKGFGRNLIVSHLAMLPFLVGIAWQWFRLCRRYVSGPLLTIALFFLFLEPTFLSQSGLISPDIAMLFFSLLVFNALLDNELFWLTVGLIGISMISLRGVLSLPAFFLLAAFLRWDQKQSWFSVKWIAPFVLTGLIVIAWLFYHYSMTGWMYSPPAETYGTHRGISDALGCIKNLVIILWRMADQGRIFLWIGLGTLLFTQKDNLKRLGWTYRSLLVMFFSYLITMSLFFALLTGPIGHRYYLFPFLLSGLMLCIVCQHSTLSWKHYILGLVSIFLVSGHFWIYPNHISKGWDATLSYIHFFQAEDELMNYLDKERIDYSSVCADFPSLNPRNISHLTEDSRSFPSKNDPKAETICEFAYYSNVMNEFREQELNSFSKNGRLIHEIKKGCVTVQLYQQTSLP